MQLKICRVCLRTDKTLRELSEALTVYYQEICDYSIGYSEYLCCSACEETLKQNYNFKKKCIKANQILRDWKRDKNQDKPHIQSLYQLLLKSLKNNREFKTEEPLVQDNYESRNKFKVDTKKSPEIIAIASDSETDSVNEDDISVNDDDDDTISKKTTKMVVGKNKATYLVNIELVDSDTDAEKNVNERVDSHSQNCVANDTKAIKKLVKNDIENGNNKVIDVVKGSNKLTDKESNAVKRSNKLVYNVSDTGKMNKKLIDKESNAIKKSYKLIDTEIIAVKRRKFADEESNIVKEINQLVEKESKVRKENNQLVDQESNTIKRGYKLADKESNIVTRSNKLVDKESKVRKKNNQLVDQESNTVKRSYKLAVKESNKPVDKESNAVKRSYKLAYKESNAVTGSNKLVEDESDTGIMNNKLIDKEITTVKRSYKLTDKESNIVKGYNQLVDKESNTVKGNNQQANKESDITNNKLFVKCHCSLNSVADDANAKKKLLKSDAINVRNEQADTENNAVFNENKNYDTEMVDGESNDDEEVKSFIDSISKGRSSDHSKYTPIFNIQLFNTKEEARREMMQRQFSEPYLSAKHRCTHCYTVYKYDKRLQFHMRWHDPAAQYACDICSMRFSSGPKLGKHRLDGHRGRFACKMCPLVTYNRSVMVTHFDMHKGKIYECTACHKTFNHVSSYRTHNRMQHKTEHVCGHCARSFVSGHGLNMHQRLLHQGERIDERVAVRCAPCGLTFASRQVYTKHVLNTDRHKDIADTLCACRLCGMSFDTEPQLRDHKRTHQPKSSNALACGANESVDDGVAVRCEPCDLTFTSRQKYTVHVLKTYKHQDVAESLIACAKCGQEFPDVGQLRRHKRADTPRIKPATTCPLCGASSETTYSGWLFRHYQMAHPTVEYKLHHVRDARRRHLCELCGKSFVTTRMLGEHMNEHAGVKPFRCDKCPATFTYKTRLREHSDRHAPPARPCAVCGKKFISASNLSNHMRLHIGDRRYKCPQCGKGFLHRASMRAHVASVHLHIRRTRKRKIPHGGDKRADDESEGVDAEMEGVDAELEGVDAELEGVDAQLKYDDAELKYDDAELEGVDANLEGADAQLKYDDAELEGVDAELEGVDADLEGADAELKYDDAELEGVDADLEGADAQLKHDDAELKYDDIELLDDTVLENDEDVLEDDVFMDDDDAVYVVYATSDSMQGRADRV